MAVRRSSFFYTRFYGIRFEESGKTKKDGKNHFCFYRLFIICCLTGSLMTDLYHIGAAVGIRCYAVVFMLQQLRFFSVLPEVCVEYLRSVLRF